MIVKIIKKEDGENKGETKMTDKNKTVCPICHGIGWINNPNRPPDWYSGDAEEWQPDMIECPCQYLGVEEVIKMKKEKQK